jgi:hypothetical protein
MKKSIIAFSATAFLMLALVVTSCMTPASKVEDAKEKVDEANENLDKAEEEYLADLAAYKTATNERIAANDELIATLKQKMGTLKKEERESYQKRVTEMELRNRKLHTKIKEYKGQGREDWENFKKEFSRDMEELGKAFNDLGKNNVE